MIRGAQTLKVRTKWRLTQHQADPGIRCRPAVGERATPKSPDGGRGGHGEDGSGRALPEGAQILAQARLQRTQRAAIKPLDEPADEAATLLERKPWIALAKSFARRNAEVATGDSQPVRPAARARQSACGEHRMEQGQAQGGEDRCGAQIAFDPLQDGHERHELAVRVQSQQLVHEVRCPMHRCEPVPCRGSRGVPAHVRRGPDPVLRIEWLLAQLGAAALVPTDRAPILPGHRHGNAVGTVHQPADLVDNQHPAARRTARGEEVTDGHLQARLAAGRGGDALEGGVQVPDIGWPQDDLGKHPVQRRRFDGDGSTLAIQGCAGDPATAPGKVRHDVTRTRVRLDPLGQQRARWWRRDALEGGQGVARFDARGDDTAGHGVTDASPRAPGTG